MDYTFIHSFVFFHNLLCNQVVLSLLAGCLSHSRSSSHGSLDEMFQSHPRQKDLDASVKQKVLEYNVYMAKYVSQSAGSPTTSPVQSAGSSPEIMKKVHNISQCLFSEKR